MEDEILNIKDVNIKNMDENDVNNLSFISKQSLLEGWSKEGFKCELGKKNSKTFIGFVNNNAIAYATGEFFKFFNLNSIAVLAGYRKNGIGKVLLNTIKTFCYNNDIEKITLEVRANNKSAIRFYQKNGFKIVGVRKNFYYRPNDDAILMDKIIARKDKN